MPPKVSFVEPDCTCRASDHPTTPVRTQSCHRHHPPNMDEILPGLFLGNLTAAESAEHLSKHGITHVLSVTSSCPLVPQGGAVVVAYVMKARHYTLDAALTHVVAQRPIVRPNSSFMRQLRAWEGAGCSPWVREELAAIVRPRVVGRAGSRRRRSVFDEEWVVVGEVGEECCGVNGGGGGGMGGVTGVVEAVGGVVKGVFLGLEGGGVRGGRFVEGVFS
ncbi:uncharacterized protein LAJ45_08897 [Morchella importuna]|uniref:uncharacterized protein n=1 Tax=Morchella importuna TaxID=1174673 RepID=UPI001E8E74F1|nr:uncharacterized protein LAJ45_08897 [Morchella importuna]KAH8147097.1 hypothetical protein LAJ45_08897 [Morchella importuna]